MARFPERVYLEPATPASDTHFFAGNVIFSATETTGIPSFTSASQRYIGNRNAGLQLSLGTLTTQTGLNAYANCYFDGTNNRYAIANETAAQISIAGKTAANSVVYVMAANNNVSHAADATFSFTTMHSIDSNGLHVIGNATTNTALVHQLHGSLNTRGAVIPSFSATRYTYMGNKLSSMLYDNGSGSAAGGLNFYGNLYFDGSGTFRSRANETCAAIGVSGATTATAAVFAVNVNNSTASAADSAVTLTSVLTSDANGLISIGNPTTNTTLINQLYGSLNLIGAVVPGYSSTTQRYIGTKLSSALFMTGSHSAAGNFNLFANQYYDGTNIYYGRANETGVNVFLTGATAATTNGYIVAMGTDLAHAADTVATNTFMHTINFNGLHTIGHPTSNDTLVHNIHGSFNISGSAVPSWSSTPYRYIGTKMALVLLNKNTAQAGQVFLYGNTYFDGTNNKRSRANETCGRLNVLGQTTATGNIYTLDADSSVSHAADSNAVYLTSHAVTAQGQHTIGVSTQPVDYQHRFWNGIGVDITSAGTQAAFFRNQSVATTAVVAVGNAQVGNGSLRWIDLCYNGSSSASPGTVHQYIGTNNVGVTGFYTPSDKTLKKNIREFKGGIEAIKKVPVVTFDYIDEARGKNLVGYIAQDVETVDAGLIAECEGKKNISRDVMVPYMHAAILEILERLEKLEAKKTKKKDEE